MVLPNHAGPQSCSRSPIQAAWASLARFRARFNSGAIPRSDVLLQALPLIRARITGIWVGRDAFTASRPERVEEYRRVLASVQPDLDFRVITGSGHWTTYEAADEVNAALFDTLRANRI